MHVSISAITFSDDTTIAVTPGDLIVIVGSNNSGKSAALRGINEKAQYSPNASPVVKSVSLIKGGNESELLDLLAKRCNKRNTPPDNPRFEGPGINIHLNTARLHWTRPEGIGDLLPFFVRYLTADARISAANPTGRINLAEQAPQHPLHLLELDDRAEQKLSAFFRKAFGTDLTLHRNAGNSLPLLVGTRPTPKPGQDRLSFEYMVELGKLPQLQNQGDGMRSFTGILLHTFLGEEPVVLIDEPEAFLHPPQARLLGRMLSCETTGTRQTIVATHSSDLLRGLLDAPQRNIRVIRIQRKDPINPIASLNAENIRALWSDPLLRYSNILDGLFHERVIVCESDSDCRFYAAIADAIYENKDGDYRPPDVMYAHCGGKARLPMVVRSLRKLSVPVAVVTDFDVLSEERPLKDIVEAAGGNWTDFSDDHSRVKKAIDDRRPELPLADARREIETALSASIGNMLSTESRKKIEKALRRSSPWAIAKEVGKTYVPSGDASTALERLLAALNNLGIFVVEVGELESFAKTVAGHGPNWVNEALKRNLRLDVEFQHARDFVSKLAL